MSRIGTFDEASGKVWYGSDQVVDSWLWTLVEKREETTRRGDEAENVGEGRERPLDIETALRVSAFSCRREEEEELELFIENKPHA